MSHLRQEITLRGRIVELWFRTPPINSLRAFGLLFFCAFLPYPLNFFYNLCTLSFRASQMSSIVCPYFTQNTLGYSILLAIIYLQMLAFLLTMRTLNIHY